MNYKEQKHKQCAPYPHKLHPHARKHILCLKLVSIRNRLNFLPWESQLRLFQHFWGRDSHTVLLIQTKKLWAETCTPLSCLTKPARATTWMSPNADRDCAYTNGFPVVAVGTDVVITQTSAADGSMFFLLWQREGLWLAGCLGFETWMAQTCRHKASATWGSR